MTERYSKICNLRAEGMRSGWVFPNHDIYIKEEEDCMHYVESLGYDWQTEFELICKPGEWFYWTEWDNDNEIEEQGYYFTKMGIKIQC